LFTGVRAPPVLVAGFLAFVLVLGYLVASSLARRAVAEFPVRHEVPARSDPDWRGPDTLTVDAAGAERWRFVDLDRGRVVEPPDTAGWDLAVRRYHVVPFREIADLGAGSFERLARRPLEGYIPSTFGRDTVNPAIGRWYSYGMLSHLLQSSDRLYVMPTTTGRFAKIQVLSYYCPAIRAGCVTFRYGFVD
jgi:hypothetical protein